MAKNLKMTFGYGEDQESTRNYNFTVEDSLAADCKDKIKAINASLAAGTAGGLSSVFISDTEEPFSKITYAELNSTIDEVLDISGGASSAQEG